MPDDFPHKHGPEIVHEHLWDECKHDIASTQKELLKISEQCAISFEIEAFNAQVSVYSSLESDATMQSATNASGIGLLIATNIDQGGSIGGNFLSLATVKSDLNEAKVTAGQVENEADSITTNVTALM